jgi:hypothetical protein
MPVGLASKSRQSERSRSQQRKKTNQAPGRLEIEAGNQAIAELIAAARNPQSETNAPPGGQSSRGEHIALGSNQFVPHSVGGRTALAQQLSHAIGHRARAQNGGQHELQAEQAERDFGGFERSSNSAAMPSAPPNRNGVPLDPRTRRSMEARLGHNFGNVRVFADTEAAAFASELDADAYTIGPNIVFGSGRYAPDTRSGSALLAHELTHVKQQQRGAPTAVMRKGKTVRGFFANIFQFWDYSKQTLNAYLAEVSRTGQIVGDHDSDDMARQIVDEWKVDKSAYNLTLRLRVLLIREMLDGSVLKSDQLGIITLLENSTNLELKEMIGSGPGKITYAEIEPKFGVLKKRLQFFNEEVLQKLSTIKTPEKGETFLEMLERTEKETGIKLDQVSISFSMAAGALYESFLADLEAKSDVNVTITLSRTRLQIRIDPALTINIIGPINPQLSGAQIDFKDSKGKVEVSQLNIFLYDKAKELVRTMLEGTRFADPNYDLTRDPHLYAELKDQTVLGDLNRIKYNLQKEEGKPSAEKEKKSKEENERRLSMVSGGRIDLHLSHPAGVRLPAKDKGWGLRVPAGTTFELSLSIEGTGAEIMKKDMVLRRLSVRSKPGVLIVDGKDDIIELSGFDIETGMKLTIGKVVEKKDIKQVAREKFPGKFTEQITGAMKSWDETVDSWTPLLDLITGERSGKSNIALDLLIGITERVFHWIAPWVAGFFSGTISEYTGMTEEQISRFFGFQPKRDEPNKVK